MLTHASADAGSRDTYAPALWTQPDPALAAAGVEGEFVVARVRVVAMGLLLLAPTWSLINNPRLQMNVTGFLVTLAAAVVSVGIWWVLRSGYWQPWVSFASSAFDVSMITLALITFLIVASPLNAINSTVTFEMYFLAVVATSLRYDARICIVIGLLAIAQYGGLWLFAATRYNLHDVAYTQTAGPYNAVDCATRLILLSVATILSVTIVRRAQRLLYLASRDRLTGLYNRGHFDRALAAAIDTAARDGRPLTLALIDIDHFKRINDEHGHDEGDAALRRVAELLSVSMRRTDIVARYGGEEFVVLMPSTASVNALARIEALRESVVNTPIMLRGGGALRMNFSAGLAGIPDDAGIVSPKDLVTLADQRLLAAKRNGRGRCIGADQPSFVHALRSTVAALTLTLALATPALAQLAPDWKAARFGGMVGLNRSTFGGDLDVENLGSLTGGVGGLTVTKPFAGGLALRGEILTTRKGAIWTTNTPGGTGRAGFELTYVDVPVMLAYELPPAIGFRPHLYAGPSFSLRTACRTRFSAQGNTSFRNCDESDTGVRSTDLAGVIGGGIGYQVRRDMLGVVGARYTHGVTKVFDDANATNRVWTFYLGVEMLQRR